MKIEKKLKRMLDVYWLRPENALISTFKSIVFDDVPFVSPSLDISCGNGLFLFLHLGGEFENNFDYYKLTRAKDFKHSSFIDIYDVCDDDYEINITRPPKTKIDYGTDWKQALLDKSSKLDLYKQLLLHDNNKLPFPFNDKYFKTIHSNSIYWVKDVKPLLNDLHRILHPDGTVILEVMTPFHLETLNELEKILDVGSIEILDRKRRETMPGLQTCSEWEKLFLDAGFEIQEIRSVYPDKIIMDIWNIGLRPISHLLIQMSNSLSQSERLRIKNEWVEIFYDLLKPLLFLRPSYELEKDPYICFILKK